MKKMLVLLLFFCQVKSAEQEQMKIDDFFAHTDYLQDKPSLDLGVNLSSLVKVDQDRDDDSNSAAILFGAPDPDILREAPDATILFETLDEILPPNFTFTSPKWFFTTLKAGETMASRTHGNTIMPISVKILSNCTPAIGVDSESTHLFTCVCSSSSTSKLTYKIGYNSWDYREVANAYGEPFSQYAFKVEKNAVLHEDSFKPKRITRKILGDNKEATSGYTRAQKKIIATLINFHNNS